MQIPYTNTQNKTAVNQAPRQVGGVGEISGAQHGKRTRYFAFLQCRKAELEAQISFKDPHSLHYCICVIISGKCCSLICELGCFGFECVVSELTAY